MPDSSPSTRLRWKLAEDAPPTLFPDEAEMERHLGIGEYRGLEFLHVNAKRIINEIPRSSPVPFRFTINAYRGCSHACVYCFARPTHGYLGLGIGEDFDTKIVVKVNAVERLRAELGARSWTGEPIAMGTNTDPYQKAEGKYHLTRRIIETLTAARNPFSILTKSTLILRDLDVLAEASRHFPVHCNFSIGTLDRDVWRATEPGTPPPDKRVDAVRKLNEAGVECGVLLAPVLPGLSDSPDQLRDVVDACVRAKARHISPIGLHLRRDVKEHYLEWIASHQPHLVTLYNKRFASRRAYQGAEQVSKLATTVRQLVVEAKARQRRRTLPMNPLGDSDGCHLDDSTR